MQRVRSNLIQALGPGLLWAGTAIGVSHLVQSTRAGAGFGLTLLWLVILANVFKYPGFEAGPRYAAATGTSLLEGYRRLGRWALVLFVLLTVSTMFTVIGAVTIVTAGMASGMVTDALPVWAWSAGLLLLAAALIGVGRYRLLDRLMKVMMLLLTVSTLGTLVLLLPTVQVSRLDLWPMVPDLQPSTLIFLCALAGWMPSALDIAVWHSLWSLEKSRVDGHALTSRGAFFDFNVGYVGTATLACIFVLLGAAVLHESGTPMPDSAPAFAKTLVDVYAAGLGEWARPIILVAAFSTMLSTTISVVDGFPRALEGAFQRFSSPETGASERTWVYWGTLVVGVVGALVLITGFAGQMRSLIDLATVLTGLTGGLFGVLNLLVIRRPEVPEDQRPSAGYTAFHIAGVIFMAAMGILLVIALVLKSQGS